MKLISVSSPALKLPDVGGKMSIELLDEFSLVNLGEYFIRFSGCWAVFTGLNELIFSRTGGWFAWSNLERTENFRWSQMILKATIGRNAQSLAINYSAFVFCTENHCELTNLSITKLFNPQSLRTSAQTNWTQPFNKSKVNKLNFEHVWLIVRCVDCL